MIEAGSQLWSPRTIEKSKGLPRGLNTYSLVFEFKLSDIQGKKILDLGCSDHASLTKDVEEKNIGATVISLSPDFTLRDIRARAKQAYPQAKSLAGLGQSLPFAKESFDFVFALHVLEHMVSYEEICRMILETAKALKPGGRGSFAGQNPSALPLFFIVNQNTELTDSLKRLGVSFEHKAVPESYGKTKQYDSSGMGAGWTLFQKLDLFKRG